MLQYQTLKHPLYRDLSMTKTIIPQRISKEDFTQEALASWKNYQETGLHVTIEEVFDWLNTWGTTSEKEAPVCHK
jgi:predicted transcriptional regulator